MKLQIPEGDFEGFIFDCDGTLADTMPLHYEAWVTILAEYGCVFPEEHFYHLGGTKTNRVVEILNEEQGLTMPVEEIVHRKEKFFLQRLPQVEPIAATVDFVRAKQGKYPMAVASGGFLTLVCETLALIGLADVFQAIVTAEDVRHGKPAPDVFLLAAERIGVEPEKCLVFEDAPTGIQAAINANMAYVLVPSAPVFA